METVIITAEELEYLTSVPEETLNEENDPSILTDEEYERVIQNCITIDEFSKRMDEAIRRLIPNP